MKNKIILIILSLSIGFMWSGCYKTHDEVVASGEAAGGVRVTNVGTGFYNLTEIQTAVAEFSIDVVANSKQISSVEVLGSLNNIAGSSFQAVQTVSSLPATISISAVDAGNVLGKAASELVLGDVFRFVFRANFTDGTSALSAASVTIPVSCPSDLAGTYTASSNATSTDGCCTDPLEGFESEVVITVISDGVYKLSDFSAGVYLEWYDVYGISPTTDLSCTIRDVCNQISFDPFNEPFGTAVVVSGGSYDPATSTITYSWVNGFDDAGTVSLVKQ